MKSISKMHTFKRLASRLIKTENTSDPSNRIVVRSEGFTLDVDVSHVSELFKRRESNRSQRSISWTEGKKLSKHKEEESTQAFTKTINELHVNTYESYQCDESYEYVDRYEYEHLIRKLVSS